LPVQLVDRFRLSPSKSGNYSHGYCSSVQCRKKKIRQAMYAALALARCRAGERWPVRSSSRRRRASRRRHCGRIRSSGGPWCGKYEVWARWCRRHPLDSGDDAGAGRADHSAARRTVKPDSVILELTNPQLEQEAAGRRAETAGSEATQRTCAFQVRNDFLQQKSSAASIQPSSQGQDQAR